MYKQALIGENGIQLTCYHHPPCHPDQVYLSVTSIVSDCASEGDVQRKDQQQTVWDLMGHFPQEHENTGPVQAVSVGK